MSFCRRMGWKVDDVYLTTGFPDVEMEVFYRFLKMSAESAMRSLNMVVGVGRGWALDKRRTSMAGQSRVEEIGWANVVIDGRIEQSKYRPEVTVEE